MPDWEDLYQILGVDPEADAEAIRDAYQNKVWILHPDRMKGAPESARQQAEEELKKLNAAYDVLKDHQKRKEYHEEWLRRGGKSAAAGAGYGAPKPEPVVDPEVIRFKDVKPGETQTASFIIRNEGGPYEEIWFDDPGGRGSWVRVVGYHSTTSDELPIKVSIEAEGEDWGKSYTEIIRVKLDEEETQVRIEIQTRPKPVGAKVGVGSILEAAPPSQTSPTVQTDLDKLETEKKRFVIVSRAITLLLLIGFPIYGVVGCFLSYDPLAGMAELDYDYGTGFSRAITGPILAAIFSGLAALIYKIRYK